jgi:hypothetical protein
MKEYRMTPDPLFPYVTTETSSELNALQLHNNKNDDVRECWDADILKCCLSHDNAIDSLTARLKYLQQKQLEKTDSSTRNNVEKQLATLQTPTNVKYLVKTNVQLKTCNSEHSSKDILPTKSDIKVEVIFQINAYSDASVRLKKTKSHVAQTFRKVALRGILIKERIKALLRLRPLNLNVNLKTYLQTHRSPLM